MGFSQESVAALVGLRRRALIDLEQGKAFPRSIVILKLGAALRVPVEFLYRDTYHSLREEIRAREEAMPKIRQGVLPLPL